MLKVLFTYPQGLIRKAPTPGDTQLM